MRSLRTSCLRSVDSSIILDEVLRLVKQRLAPIASVEHVINAVRLVRHVVWILSPEEFYEALLACAEYWEELLRDFGPATLPQHDWIDMSKHSFVKEMMARPGGVYPKYGVVERVYAGSEHDGFPDIFTNAVYVNLDWGRFDTAKSFIENYFLGHQVISQGIVRIQDPHIRYHRDERSKPPRRTAVKSTQATEAEFSEQFAPMTQSGHAASTQHGCQGATWPFQAGAR